MAVEFESDSRDITASGLEQWINDYHLQEKKIEQYSQEIINHPANLIVIDSILKSSVVKNLEGFMKKEALFRRVNRLYSENDFVSDERWKNASEEDRFFTYYAVDGVRSEFKVSPNWLGFLRLNACLREKAWLHFLSNLSGNSIEKYESAQLHAHGIGDATKLHNDAKPGRVLCAVFYFSRNWRPQDDGALCVIDSNRHTYRVDVKYNRAIFFDPRKSRHYVQRCSCQIGDRLRYSLVAWFCGRS